MCSLYFWRLGRLGPNLRGMIDGIPEPLFTSIWQPPIMEPPVFKCLTVVCPRLIRSHYQHFQDNPARCFRISTQMGVTTSGLNLGLLHRPVRLQVHPSSSFSSPYWSGW